MKKANIHQIRAAMRMAITEALERCYDPPDDLVDSMCDAVFEVENTLAYVMQNPCKCSLGSECHFVGMPPGDDDTGHCQNCGVFMQDDVSPGNLSTCISCGCEYEVGDSEDIATT